MKHYRLTPAFSMLELIFVIVILGIVASIGSEMIAKVYESYIVQRAEHSATLKTELAATQIANRLASAIPGTVIRKDEPGDTAYEGINDPMSIDSNLYSVLQWVSSDTDSFNFYDSATTKVGWSGFCDVNASTTNIIQTPGSNLILADAIITNLGGDGIENAAIYFPYDNAEHNLSGATGEVITLAIGATPIVEHYKLAWSSYALVVDSNRDLYLYYNFQPSPAAAIGTTKSLLLKNVATFKFQGAGRTIRFKICVQERISEDLNITSCKEKAVF